MTDIIKYAPRTWTVSYTHLDVYKRQAVTLDTNSVSNAACFGPLAITVQGFRAQPPGRGFDLGAGALLLILGLLFMRRPVQAIVDPCSYDGKAQAT